MIDTMDREVAAAVQRNQHEANAVLTEARKRIPGFVLDSLLTAETRARDASIAYSAAQQPPQPAGDVRERALTKLEWQETLNDARAAYQTAEQALQRARATYQQSERNALNSLLDEARVQADRCHKALAAKVGGAWSVQQVNGMLASDPSIGVLMADEQKANDRVNVIAKAIRTLYG